VNIAPIEAIPTQDVTTHENKRKLEEEHEELESKRPKENESEENSECVICLTAKKNILFMPCKHLGCCKECSNKVLECPLCRTPVQSKITVFV